MSISAVSSNLFSITFCEYLESLIDRNVGIHEDKNSIKVSEAVVTPSRILCSSTNQLTITLGVSLHRCRLLLFDLLMYHIDLQPVLEIRIRNCSAVFKDILQVTDYCPIENVQEIWPTKIDFGWSKSKIGRKWPKVDCYFQHWQQPRLNTCKHTCIYICNQACKINRVNTNCTSFIFTNIFSYECRIPFL